MVGLDHRPLAGELRRRRGGGVGGLLLVLVHQQADVLLHLAELGEGAIDALEERDDLALDGLALGERLRGVQLGADLLELLSEGVDERF